MKVVEAVVEPGGVLRLEGLPFKAGSHLFVHLEERKSSFSPDEWREHVDSLYGSLSHTSLEAPADSPAAEIEPLW